MGPDWAIALGVAFWICIALLTSALPVQMRRGTWLSVSVAPIIACMNLGGPIVAGWVALIGSTEMRELRGRIPWYGTLANHAMITLPALAGGVVLHVLRGGHAKEELLWDFAATMAAATVYLALNLGLASLAVSLRSGVSLRIVLLGDARDFAGSLFGLAPLAWLMGRIYLQAGWWATLLFALPLWTTRVAHSRFVEMREMFTQTIESLANAVDKRDPFTSNHSKRVMLIASDIGREMKCSEPEMEALEWGGLLHDIGKIGVRDEILLKQEKLTREERMKMNAHPELGAEIIAPVRKLAAELPIIRHHHEWYNGSGYPDRLIGTEIPWLARILHVADAFEAMTAQRPYRMTPLTAEQALSELRKFAGIQFDPAVVDAFVRTNWVDGVPDPGRVVTLRPIPLLAQAAGRMAQVAAGATPLPDPGASPTDAR
ncbi:MAG: HD domain-containing protein [Chloroflexi bacterium]|nr:MAG: HD domain-containing protein [Chloroflexota bacterium]